MKDDVINDNLIEDVEAVTAQQAVADESDAGEIKSGGTPVALKTDVGGRRVSISRLNTVLRGCILAGTNKVQQAINNEKMVIDDSWIIKIEDYIHSVENVVRNPKTFIKEERELVAAERARNSDRESVRHLSSHSEHVRDFKDGEITPKNVLVKHRLEDFATYENRVTYSLIRNLKLFIEQRYSSIKDLVKFYETTMLSMDSKFDFGKAKIEYGLNMKIAQRTEGADKCQALLERLERIRKRVQIMDNSSFAKELKAARLVKPPLARTNLLMKNVDYRNVYNLWVFISSFTEQGYTVEVSNKITPFDDEYTSDLTRLIAESVKVMIRNNTINKDTYKGIEFKTHKAKKFLIKKKVNPVLTKHDEDILPTDRGINQFYFDRIKQYFDRELFERQKKKGTSEPQTIDAVFKRFAKSLTNISVKVLQDVVQQTSKAKAKKRLQKPPRTAIDSAKLKIKTDEEVEKSFDVLVKLKAEELASLKKKKRQITTNLAKQRKELEKKIIKAKQDAERKELAKQKAREMKELAKQKAREKLAAQRKLDAEKKAKEKQRELERKAKEMEKAKAAADKAKDTARNKTKSSAAANSAKTASTAKRTQKPKPTGESNTKIETQKSHPKAADDKIIQADEKQKDTHDLEPSKAES